MDNDGIIERMLSNFRKELMSMGYWNQLLSFTTSNTKVLTDNINPITGEDDGSLISHLLLDFLAQISVELINLPNRDVNAPPHDTITLEQLILHAKDITNLESPS